jgi:hypothetical protein
LPTPFKGFASPELPGTMLPPADRIASSSFTCFASKDAATTERGFP